MADTGVDINGLPAAALPLDPSALLEVQVGSGPGSSQKILVTDLGGGGGLSWSTVAADTAMEPGSGYIVTGARTMTLPLNAEAGGEFVVHSYDAVVTVASNGNVVTGVGAGNNLTIAAGETAHLVVRSTGNLEIV